MINMTAKEHYQHHLGNFYSWMTGDFAIKQVEQLEYFKTHNIFPFHNRLAIDLGCGHGLQSVALAKLGFQVRAVDFNVQLRNELRQNKEDHNIEIIEDDLLHYLNSFNEKAELIVCMGDTLTHLETAENVHDLFRQAARCLSPGGRITVSFRDLSTALEGTQRFLPVRSDNTRILTCFLEYFPDYVMVHDILHERENGKWVQKISAYPKLRLNEEKVSDMIRSCGLEIVSTSILNRMIYIIAQKNA